MTGPIRVREMRPDEIYLRIHYFHSASDEHLARLGVDRSRLPAAEDWRDSYLRDTARPLPEREGYALVWEADGEVIGFSTADRIRFGVDAFMHLHIIEAGQRRQGLGARFVRLSAAGHVRALDLQRLYCRPNALNVAPNRTLQRAGFTYDRGEFCRPSEMNTEQVVTRWVVERADALSWV